jgi:PAS domain S-box-containing protein
MRNEMIDQRDYSSTQSSDFLTEVSNFPSDKICAWLFAVIQSAMDGVVIIDATRHIVLLNREAERMFGYTAKELLGKPLDMLVATRTRHEHGLTMARFFAANSIKKEIASTGFQMEGMRASGEEFSIKTVVTRVRVRGEIFLAVILREAVHSDPATLKRAAAPLHSRRRAASSQQANEVEKRRISRELYDDLGQRLSVLKLDMDWLETRMPNSDKLSPTRIAQMQVLLDNIIIRTKSIASSLRPPLLDDFGLLAAVKWVAENFQKRTAIACKVESHGMTIKPGDAIESAIFRVVQEGLLNIERHAHARHVNIILWHTNNRLDVIIEDNGIGMPIGSENKIGCFGLIAMQERIYNLGGSINISNIDPQGVSIHASVPVELFSYPVSAS